MLNPQRINKMFFFKKIKFKFMIQRLKFWYLLYQFLTSFWNIKIRISLLFFKPLKIPSFKYNTYTINILKMPSRTRDILIPVPLLDVHYELNIMFHLPWHFLVVFFLYSISISKEGSNFNFILLTRFSSLKCFHVEWFYFLC